MDFASIRNEALSWARRIEIDIEVKAMGAVPHLNSFAGLVYCIDAQGRTEGPSIVDRKSDELFQAASINKLAIALALANLLVDVPENEMRASTVSWERSEVTAGGGSFDGPDASVEASLLELIYDMLANSGNTAAKALVKTIGVRIINQQLNELGFSHTQLKELENNTFEFGTTTPREAITILKAISDSYHIRPGNQVLLSAARTALNESTSKYGVRGTVGNVDRFLMNKTGQLNQDDQVPEALRHDVGIFHGSDGRSILYAFFSRASADSAAQAANIAIGDLGHLLAREAGLEETVDIIMRRHLAQTALKGVASKASKKVKNKAIGRYRSR